LSESFGEYLRNLRKKKGLTLKELGEEIGFSYSYLSQLERGERGVQGIPSPEFLKLLYKPLGADFYEMMEVAGHLPKGSKEHALSASTEQNRTLENYLDQIYKAALIEPNAAIPLQVKESIEKHISISDEDNKLSIMKKIMDLDDLQAKDDISFDMWMAVHELSENEMEYILSTNEGLTYKRISLTKNDRKLITLFLDALIDGRAPTDKTK